MKIMDIHPDSVVKIGAVKGSGFLYIGRFGDADLSGIDRECREKVKQSISKARYKMRLSSEKERRQMLKERVDTLKEYVDKYIPFGDREIVERYPSLVDDGVDIVLTSGIEVEARGFPTQIGESLQVMDETGSIRLAGAIIRGMMDFLVRKYVEIYTKGRSQETIGAAKRAEDRITESRLMLIRDPRYLINVARNEAAEEVVKRVTGISRKGVIWSLGWYLDEDEKSM